MVVAVVVWQVEDSFLLFLGQHVGWDRDLSLIIQFTATGWQRLPVSQFYHLRNECRDIVSFREYQHDVQFVFLRQQLQQLLQPVTCLRVESDKRIVHDEQTGVGKQRLGQLELSEFST